MITVVIPTLWKASTFEIQLIQLCKCDYVDEIILINNNQKNTPNYEILTNNKIKHVKLVSNIFVNPAWNLGISLSKNNNICLLNDDILFDINVFEFMSSHKNVTLCGLGMYSQDGDLRLVEIDVRNTGFGCMMFLTKNDYKEVPKELLVYYGDDYMIFKNKLNGNKTYRLDGCKNNNVCAISSSEFCNAFLSSERDAYATLTKRKQTID